VLIQKVEGPTVGIGTAKSDEFLFDEAVTVSSGIADNRLASVDGVGGTGVGEGVGAVVGYAVGTAVGVAVGTSVGTAVGVRVGSAVGD